LAVSQTTWQNIALGYAAYKLFCLAFCGGSSEPPSSDDNNQTDGISTGSGDGIEPTGRNPVLAHDEDMPHLISEHSDLIRGIHSGLMQGDWFVGPDGRGAYVFDDAASRAKEAEEREFMHRLVEAGMAQGGVAIGGRIPPGWAAFKLARLANRPPPGGLRHLARTIRLAGESPQSRNMRTIAVGQDEAGNLKAGSSRGFDKGQRECCKVLGIEMVPSSAGKHAEENLLKGFPGMRRIGTDARQPCGPGEHNCAAQLRAAGVQIEAE